MWNLKDAPAFAAIAFTVFFIFVLLPVSLRRGWFRFARDTWTSTEASWMMLVRRIVPDGLLYILIHDKIQHFLGGILVAIFSVKWSIIIWFLWEMKDGYLPFERFGLVGGDGFSWKDMLAAWAGAALVAAVSSIQFKYVP